MRLFIGMALLLVVAMATACASLVPQRTTTMPDGTVIVETDVAAMELLIARADAAIERLIEMRATLRAEDEAEYEAQLAAQRERREVLEQWRDAILEEMRSRERSRASG